jgi:hypothetical protein
MTNFFPPLPIRQDDDRERPGPPPKEAGAPGQPAVSGRLPRGPQLQVALPRGQGQRRSVSSLCISRGDLAKSGQGETVFIKTVQRWWQLMSAFLYEVLAPGVCEDGFAWYPLWRPAGACLQSSQNVHADAINTRDACEMWL